MKIAIIISILLASCSSRSSEPRENQEAIVLHNSMTKKVNLIEHRLNELRSDTTVNKDSLKILSGALEEWKVDLVEVPGNEDHDHGGHSHGHSALPDVTEDQMLEIQKELDKRLSHIGIRIQQLKPETNATQHIH